MAHPYRSSPGGAVHALEPATRRLPGDLDGMTFEVGRLILTDDGLYFIAGWQELRGRSRIAVLGVLFGAEVGALTTSASNDPHVIAEGRRHLAELRGLPPEQQLARSSGSLHVPSDDIAATSLGRFFAPLRVTTRRHGDLHTFELPRSARATAHTWIAQRPRDQP